MAFECEGGEAIDGCFGITLDGERAPVIADREIAAPLIEQPIPANDQRLRKLRSQHEECCTDRRDGAQASSPEAQGRVHASSP